MDVKQILHAAEEGMKKAIDHCHIDLAKIRTGRASTSLLDSVRVDYYGSPVPLSQGVQREDIPIRAGHVIARPPMRIIDSACGFTTPRKTIPRSSRD